MSKHSEAEEFVPLTPGKDFPKEAFKRSVVEDVPKGDVQISNSHGVLTIQISSFADNLPAWGSNVRARDRELREFWKSEDMLKGAIYNVCVRNGAFEWKIDAPPQTKIAVTNMLQNAIAGQSYGWIPFIMTFSLDLLTQDNGAFIEVIRSKNRPDGPVIGIRNLDSGRCQRTGNPDIPILYTDRESVVHKLNWWNVISASEFPSAIETMNGVGFCAVSRVLTFATIMKNIAIFRNEKVSGRFYKALHFVGGIGKAALEDVMERGQEEADNAGQSRFILPTVLAGLDPEKPVSVATIDLASLPDNFNLDDEYKWYITMLAMGFGVDYQDFAPLPGGNLGTSTQSETLHKKSSGKSPKLFMEMIQNLFHYYGVLPRNARFVFKDQDLAAELEGQKLQRERAQARAIRIRAGEIDPATAREIAFREGDLTAEELAGIPEEFGTLDTENPDRNKRSDGSDTIGDAVARVDKGYRSDVIDLMDQVVANR